LAAGKRLDLGNVVLPEAASIRARARALDGTPLVRESVLLCPLDPRGPAHSFERLAERLTDDLGRVRWVDLSPGSYVLRLGLRWPNFMKVVEIRLVPGRVVEGRMLLPDGSPCQEGTVRALWVTENPPRRRASRTVPVDAQGRFFAVLDPAVRGPVTLAGQSIDESGAACGGVGKVPGSGDGPLTLHLHVAPANR